MTSPRLSFIVEHYDTLAQMVKKYQLFYYPEDASIEMYDIKKSTYFPKANYKSRGKNNKSISRLGNIYI